MQHSVKTDWEHRNSPHPSAPGHRRVQQEGGIRAVFPYRWAAQGGQLTTLGLQTLSNFILPRGQPEPPPSFVPPSQPPLPITPQSPVGSAQPSAPQRSPGGLSAPTEHLSTARARCTHPQQAARPRPASQSRVFPHNTHYRAGPLADSPHTVTAPAPRRELGRIPPRPAAA